MCGWDVETTFVSPPVRPTFCKAEDEESADFGAQKYGRSPGKCEVHYGIESDLSLLCEWGCTFDPLQKTRIAYG